MQIKIMLRNILILPLSAWVVVAVSVGALASALISQYAFGYDPCVLCLWQRVPYVLAFVLAVTSLLSMMHGKWQAVVFLACCIPVFLGGAGVAFFHTGVELHWWLGTDGCTLQPLHTAETMSWRDRLLATPTAHCDQITWTFLGFSMANWNVALSLALAFFTALAVIKEGALKCCFKNKRGL